MARVGIEPTTRGFSEGTLTYQNPLIANQVLALRSRSSGSLQIVLTYGGSETRWKHADLIGEVTTHAFTHRFSAFTASEPRLDRFRIGRAYPWHASGVNGDALREISIEVHHDLRNLRQLFFEVFA